jgi:hypothetical protein
MKPPQIVSFSLGTSELRNIQALGHQMRSDAREVHC